MTLIKTVTYAKALKENQEKSLPCLKIQIYAVSNTIQSIGNINNK